MNVQDKQQGQGGPIGAANTDAADQAGDPTGTEPITTCQGCVETSPKEQTSQLAAQMMKGLQAAADVAGVGVEELTGRTRRSKCCLLRQIVAYWLFTEYGYQKREIGEVFCRDRATIYWSVKQITQQLAVGDRRTNKLWDDFKKQLKAGPKQKEKQDNKQQTITNQSTMGVLHDLTGMPEWQKKREYVARLLTNLTFEVADVLETLWVECEERNRECGYQMAFEQKRHYNAAMHHIKAFRGATRGLEAEQQEAFGRDSELLLDLIYAAVTRTGTDDTQMHRFLEYIMSFPDRVGLDGVRKGGEAFEAIKMAMAQGRLKAYEELQKKEEQK